MPSDVYDDFAERYDAENTSSLLNEYYNRPAILNLVGDVRGHRVLDVGCGAGTLTAGLQKRGALVSGFDGSPAMIELARRRLGDEVPLAVADIADVLPYSAGAFDDVVASLVLHYVEDWSGPLTEFRRILAPHGALVVSVPHPFVRVFTHPDEDYFATRLYEEEYEFDGAKVRLAHWHRPLHAMTDAFTGAGFEIVSVSEPAPSPDTPTGLLTERMRLGETSSFLAFLFFVLRRAD